MDGIKSSHSNASFHFSPDLDETYFMDCSMLVLSLTEILFHPMKLLLLHNALISSSLTLGDGRSIWNIER